MRLSNGDVAALLFRRDGIDIGAVELAGDAIVDKLLARAHPGELLFFLSRFRRWRRRSRRLGLADGLGHGSRWRRLHVLRAFLHDADFTRSRRFEPAFAFENRQLLRLDSLITRDRAI